MDPTNANEESCSWKLLVLFCSFKILAAIKLQARPMRIYGDILVNVDYRIFFFFFLQFHFRVLLFGLFTSFLPSSICRSICRAVKASLNQFAQVPMPVFFFFFCPPAKTKRVSSSLCHIFFFLLGCRSNQTWAAGNYNLRKFGRGAKAH